MERTTNFSHKEISELVYALALAQARNNSLAVDCSLKELSAQDSDTLEDYKAERASYSAAADIDAMLIEKVVSGKVVMIEVD